MSAADEDLIAAIRAGDPDGVASRTLFERHWSAVLRAARRFSDPSSAEDVAQETMVRVFEAIENGGGPDSSFRAYAVASARNVAATWARKARAEPYGDIAELAAIGNDGPWRTEDLQQTVADRDFLAQAFKRLADRYQQVLWYTVVENRTPAELAPVFGVSPNCVAVIACRARERLRQAWLMTHLDRPGVESDCERALGQMVRQRRGASLPSVTRSHLQEHLAQCDECRGAVVPLDELAARLPAVIGPGMVAMGALAWPTVAESTRVGGHVLVERFAAITLKTKAMVTAAAVLLAGAGTAAVVAVADADVPPPAKLLEATVTVVPAPQVSTVETDPSWLLPLLAGTGSPGATVVALADGAEAGRVTVGADGRWSLSPSTLPPGEHGLVVKQGIGGRWSSPAGPEIVVHLEAPTLSAPDSEPMPDGDGYVIGVRGLPGKWARISVDGVPALGLLIPDDGLLRGVWPQAAPGVHKVAAWYVDPTTGRVGAKRTGCLAFDFTSAGRLDAAGVAAPSVC